MIGGSAWSVVPSVNSDEDDGNFWFNAKSIYVSTVVEIKMFNDSMCFQCK